MDLAGPPYNGPGEIATVSERVVDGALSPLAASMLVGGLTKADFARWSVDFNPQSIAIDALGLSLPVDARQRLAGAVEAASADPSFCTEFVAALDTASGGLTERARTASETARKSPSTKQLVEEVAGIAGAARSLAPAVLVAPLIRERLKRSVTHRLGAGIGDGMASAEHVAWAGRPPAAVEALYDCYRIAAEMAGHEQAAESVRELSGKGALRKLRNDHPVLHGMVVEHVERFGWLRAQSGAVAPMTPRELMQRITITLVRWTPETIAQTAEPTRPWDVASVLGGAPSQELGELIEPLQRLTTGVNSGTQALGRAQGLAWSCLVEVAARVQCEPAQLVFSTLAELQDAALAGEVLPLDEVDLRRSEGFTLQTDDGRIGVGGPPPVKPLPGQTGSMGRAVGRARVVLDADEGNRLRPGDVLVTHLSTPTYEGEPSLFPYRSVPSVGIEKAAAVVTDEGGLLSHAGIICRENSVPSIIGAEGASTMLIDGQVVEVDATKGAGSIIVWSSPEPPPELAVEM